MVKKAPPVHSLIYLTKVISKRYISFPIGSVLCQTHLKKQRKNKIFSEMKLRTLHQVHYLIQILSQIKS